MDELVRLRGLGIWMLFWAGRWGRSHGLVETDGGCSWMDHAFSERNLDRVCHVYRKESSKVKCRPVGHRCCNRINDAQSSVSAWIAPIDSVWFFDRPWCQTTAQYSSTGRMTDIYQWASRSAGRPGRHIPNDTILQTSSSKPWN